MAKKEDGFAGGADRAEADFEEVAETGFSVPLAASAEAVGEVFDPLDSSVKCQPIFSWGFLKNEVAEICSDPLIPADGTGEDRFRVHACRL